MLSHLRTPRERFYRARTGALVFAACVVVWTAWAVAFLAGEDFRSALAVISPRAAAAVSGSGALSVLILLASLISAVAGVTVFIRWRSWFWGLLISGFALSEMQISFLNYVGFVVRYTFICVITAAGVVAIVSGDKGPGKTVRIIALAYLVWLLISMTVHGVSGATAAMLPMQFALMLGVFWGLMQEFREAADAKWLCTMIGRLGAVFTLLHLTALVMATEPFLGGRFKSYFVLPTNFADRYALLYMAMIWAAITDRSALRRIALWGCMATGAVLLVLSGTRNAALMIVIALCVLSLVWKVRILALIGGVSVAVLIGVAALVTNTSQMRFAADRISNLDASNRYQVWALAWNYITQQPFVGYGLGTTGSTMLQGVERSAVATFVDAHNAYMGIWLQLGLVGVVLIVMLYLHTFRKGFSVVFGKAATTQAEIREVIALPLAMLCALFAGGMFEENLSSRGSLPQLMWSLSILLVASLADVAAKGFGARKERLHRKALS